MLQCVIACSDCADACTRAAAHGARLGGRFAEADLQCLLQDCIDLCTTTGRMLGRGSPYHVAACQDCAAVCRACVDECQRRGGDERVFGLCAQACQKAADSCQRIADAALREGGGREHLAAALWLRVGRSASGIGRSAGVEDAGGARGTTPPVPGTVESSPIPLSPKIDPHRS